MKKITTEEKRRREARMVEEMIYAYCKKNHSTTDTLCEACNALLEYARARTDSCPFMEQKNFCSSCKVHCYKPDMRERIRTVMRMTGPWMLIHHPIMAISHIIEEYREKRRKK